MRRQIEKMYDPAKYHKYKDYYKEYKARKVICECGAETRYDKIKRHKDTSKKHQNFISLQIPDTELSQSRIKPVHLGAQSN